MAAVRLHMPQPAQGAAPQLSRLSAVVSPGRGGRHTVPAHASMGRPAGGSLSAAPGPAAAPNTGAATARHQSPAQAAVQPHRLSQSMGNQAPSLAQQPKLSSSQPHFQPQVSARNPHPNSRAPQAPSPSGMRTASYGSASSLTAPASQPASQAQAQTPATPAPAAAATPATPGYTGRPGGYQVIRQQSNGAAAPTANASGPEVGIALQSTPIPAGGSIHAPVLTPLPNRTWRQSEGGSENKAGGNSPIITPGLREPRVSARDPFKQSRDEDKEKEKENSFRENSFVFSEDCERRVKSTDEKVTDVQQRVQGIETMLKANCDFDALRTELTQAKEAERHCSAMLVETREELKQASSDLQMKDHRVRELECQVRVLAEASSEIEAQRAAKEQERREHDLGREMRALSQETRDLEARLEEADCRCKALEKENAHYKTILQRRDQQETSLAEREAQAERRERELFGKEDVTRQNEQLQADLLQQRRTLDVEKEELSKALAALDAERKEFEVQSQRQMREMMRQKEEHLSRYANSTAADKENKRMQQTIQAQKKKIWELEDSISKERIVSNFLTPGEFAKMARNHRQEYGFQQQCDEKGFQVVSLKRELTKACELNKVLQKHLPADARQRAALEWEQKEKTARQAIPFEVNQPVFGEPAQEPAP